MLELDAFGGAGGAGASPAEGTGTQPQSQQRRVAGGARDAPGHGLHQALLNRCGDVTAGPGPGEQQLPTPRVTLQRGIKCGLPDCFLHFEIKKERNASK